MSNEALNDFVKLMTETLKQAKDFTLAQSPEVMKEIVRIGIIKGVASCVASLFLMAVAFWIHVRIQRIYKADKYSDAPLFYILSVMLLVLGIFFFVDGFSTVLDASLAPRMYLLTYFSQLVHK